MSLKVIVEASTYPEEFNPRDPLFQDNICKFAFRFYNESPLADITQFEKLSQLYEALREADTVIHIYPVYKYEHGGIALSLTSFSCPFDSGVIGFAYTIKEHEDPRSIIAEELKEYEAYLNGEVYRVSLVEESICPCCGAKSETVIDSLDVLGLNNIKGLTSYFGEEYAKLLESPEVRL